MNHHCQHKQNRNVFPHPGNVGNHLECEPAARDGAAGGHPSEKVVSEALAARVNVDADSLPQDQLHVSRVTELDDHSNSQVHPLLGPRAPPTELGTLVDGGVP